MPADVGTDRFAPLSSRATSKSWPATSREVADGEFPHSAAVGQDDRGPVWVFSGQGSQWAAMGAELLATEPVFAATVAEAEPLIARESSFSVTEAISAPDTVSGIDRVQPALFVMQIALAATMKSYGVRPGAVIGHSMGEAAAAVVAGALSLADGVRVICRRSRLMATISGSGAMASVELPAQQVLSELMARGVNDEVVVAVVASPQSTVIGGATETVRELVATWEQRDVMAREVAVDVASHSPQVDPILDELTDSLGDLNPKAPEIPFYSSTMFDPRDEPECDAWYWADNLRHTVRFAAAVQAALEDGYRVFAELSPHPLLTHAVEQTARSLDMPLAALAAMRREQELPHGLRDFLADLHSAGAEIDFSVLYPKGRLVDVPLPACSNRPLLLTPVGQDSRARGEYTVAVHPLVGAHVRLQEEPERHVWQGEVGTGAQPWLADHQIHNVAVLPGAAYCEMALAAARTVLGEAAEVSDIRFEQMLMLDEETPVGAVASIEAPGVFNFAVETHQDGQHLRRASAVLRAVDDEHQPPVYDLDALRASHLSDVDLEEIAKRCVEHDVQYGPAFSGLVARIRCRRRGQHGAGRGRAARLDPLTTAVLRDSPRSARCLLPVGRGASRRPGRGQRRTAGADGRAAHPRLRLRPHRPLLLHEGDASRRGRDRSRPRPAGRAGHGPAGGAWTAARHWSFRRRKPRSDAERAVVDHRMATAKTAGNGLCRTRSMAAASARSAPRMWRPPS